MKQVRIEIPCQPSLDCQYYPNCKMSIHHEVPRRVGKEAVAQAVFEDNFGRAKLVRDFVECPKNKMFVCRRIHDLLDKTPLPLPSEPDMQRAVDGV